MVERIATFPVDIPSIEVASKNYSGVVVVATFIIDRVEHFIQVFKRCYSLIGWPIEGADVKLMAVTQVYSCPDSLTCGFQVKLF